LDTSLTLRLKYPTDFRQREINVVFRKMLQYRITKRRAKSVGFERQKASIATDEHQIGLGVESSSRRHDRTQRRVYADYRPALAHRRDRPSTPITTHIQQELTGSVIYRDVWYRIVCKPPNGAGIPIAGGRSDQIRDHAIDLGSCPVHAHSFSISAFSISDNPRVST
jgi:hypothetical protein